MTACTRIVEAEQLQDDEPSKSTFFNSSSQLLRNVLICLCPDWSFQDRVEKSRAGALTRTLQICRFFSPSFGGRMASAFSLVKSRSLYLVIGPMWQKFILLTIPHYSKIDWPLTLFCTRSPPFMSSDVIFLQAKWSKIKERVKGWKSGKKKWFKRITVWIDWKIR